MYFPPFLLVSQSTNDVAKHEKTLVDVNAFAQTLSLGTSSLRSFRTRQINEMEFTLSDFGLRSSKSHVFLFFLRILTSPSPPPLPAGL